MKSDPNDQYDGSLTEKMSKPRKRRVSSEDVLQMQYNCLSLQRENLLLKNRKLTLQVQLLEQQVQSTTYTLLWDIVLERGFEKTLTPYCSPL